MSKVIISLGVVFSALSAVNAAVIYTYTSAAFSVYQSYRYSGYIDPYHDPEPQDPALGTYWCDPTLCKGLTFQISVDQASAPNMPDATIFPSGWSVSDGEFSVSGSAGPGPTSDIFTPYGTFGWATDASGPPSTFDLSVYIDRIDGDSTDSFSASANGARTFNVHGGIGGPGISYRPVAGSEADGVGRGQWVVADAAIDTLPEPATMWMLSLGTAGLIAGQARRERNRKRAERQ